MPLRIVQGLEEARARRGGRVVAEAAAEARVFQMKKHPKNSRGLVAQEFVDYTGESNGRFHSIDSQTASEDSMLLKGKSMNLNSALQQRVDALGVDLILYQFQSMSSKSMIKLKEKLMAELVNVRVALERIEAKEAHAVSALPNPAASLESGFPGVRVAESSPQTHRGFPKRKEPVGFNRQPSFASDGRNGFDSGKEKRTPKANQLYSNRNYVGATDKAPSQEKPKPKASSSAGVKRWSSGTSRVELPKKQKVVDSRFGPCFDILKVLMNHKFSWVFNEPVDPEKLNIPDYFSIISNPMDLGTIKQRLETERYSSPMDFVADVRLTFENAKTYNPPSNNVHQWAVALSDLFERRWKSAKAKLGGDEMFHKVAQPRTQVSNVDQDLQLLSSKPVYVQSLPAVRYQSQPFSEKQFNPSKKHNPSLNHAKKQNGPLNHSKKLSQPQQSVKRIPGQNKARERDTSSKMQMVNAKPSPQKLQKPEQSHPKEKPTRRPMTGEEKTQLLNDLQSIESEAPTEIILFLKNHLPPSENEEDIEIDVEALGDDLLWELRELLSNFFVRKQDAAAAQVDDAAVTSHLQENERETKELHIDAGGADDEIVDILGDGGPLTTNNELENLGIPINDTSSNSSSDSGSSSSSSDSDNASANDSDAEDMGNNNTGHHAGNSDPETTGLVSTLDEENVHPKASVDGDAHQEGESAPPERQVSPDKQLRAALMRSRFADTILKAREKTLPQSNNGDPEKMRKEREQLEKLQREEKARIEADAKAAEAVRKQAEVAAAAEAKRKREMEREAQRLRLQKMERTVEIDENNQILKDLERLSYAQPDQVPSSADETSPVGSLEGLGDFQLQPGDNPLQKLGLFIKDEDEEHFMEDEAVHMDIDQVDENTSMKTGENAGTNNGSAVVVAADVEEGEID